MALWPGLSLWGENETFHTVLPIWGIAGVVAVSFPDLGAVAGDILSGAAVAGLGGIFWMIRKLVSEISGLRGDVHVLGVQFSSLSTEVSHSRNMLEEHSQRLAALETRCHLQHSLRIEDRR